MKRFLGGILLALATGVAPAATTAERSPMWQGLWWDMTRSGHGFEIFTAADQVAVFWFTYDATGRPTWYTAQGNIATLGRERWPLLKHRWADGRKQAPTAVGELKLTVANPQEAEVEWVIGLEVGRWRIAPFLASGVQNERDHGGAWFDPANSGWGLTLIDQGDILGGAIFTYDANGEPTWVSGFSRGRTVEYSTFRGPCPACPGQAVTGTPVGTVSYEFLGETRLVARTSLALPMAQGVRIDGVPLAILSRPSSLRAADRSLATFATAESLKSFLDAAMLAMPSPTISDFSASPPPTAFSTTNLQERGVDEPDLVKSDGRRIYTFAHDAQGLRMREIRVATIDADGLQVRGSVPLAGGTAMDQAGLFLHADKLVAVTGTTVLSHALAAPWNSPSAWAGGKTHVQIMGASGEGLPQPLWRAELDGHFLASRRIGERLYVATRYVPQPPGFRHGAAAGTQQGSYNRQILSQTALEALLPQVAVNGGAAVPALDYSKVYLPPQGSRPALADLVTVTAIDLATPRVLQSLGVFGGAEAVYVSSANLYLATSRYQLTTHSGALLPEPPYVTTDVHQVALGPGSMILVGSGSIEGSLGADAQKAPFRMSERQGRLRVVSSSGRVWGALNRNRLTILEPSSVVPNMLKTVSFLPNAGRPETLGKPGEVLYGTRFVDDRLYAVTFRNVDPLYVVDLSNAADPRITGALEVPGFSDYLHPLPNGLLLGFGKDAKPHSEWGDGNFAWYQGLALALFDVRDGGAPRELQRVVIGKRGSDSALLRSHHALSTLLDAAGFGTLAFPAKIHDTTPLWGTGDSTTYAWQESALMRFELRGTAAADARLVPLPPLVTHRAPQPQDPWAVAAAARARSVLFGAATVYVADGRFWHQDAQGRTSGPF